MVGGRLVSPVIMFITFLSEKNQIINFINQIGDIWNADEERKGAGIHSILKGKYIFNPPHEKSHAICRMNDLI